MTPDPLPPHLRTLLEKYRFDPDTLLSWKEYDDQLVIILDDGRKMTIKKDPPKGTAGLIHNRPDTPPPHKKPRGKAAG